jgi:hypothetical protein
VLRYPVHVFRQDSDFPEGGSVVTRKFLTRNLANALLGAIVLTPFAAAHADQLLNITYFQIAHSDNDGGRLCCSNSSNYVQSTLGVNGLPVLNPGGENGPVPDDVLGDGELTWWSPTLNNGGSGGSSDVTQTGTGTVSIPYANNDFYSPNGTGSNDSTYYQAAIMSGTLSVPSPETVSFTLSSDDMAFVYINGQIVCDDGGVHGASPTNCTSVVLSGSNNTIELFYVDLDPSGAALDFTINTAGINTAPPPATPEPTTFTLLGSGLLGLAGVVRRKIGSGT